MKNAGGAIWIFLAVFIILSAAAKADLFFSSRNGSIYFNTTGVGRLFISPGGNLTLLGVANLSVPGNVYVGGGYSEGGITLVGVGSGKGTAQIGKDILLDGQIVSIIDVEINRSFIPVRDSFSNLGNRSNRFQNAYIINVLSGNQTLSLNANVSVIGNLTVDGNTLVVDDKNNRIGIGKSPNYALDVAGQINASALNITGNARISAIASCAAVETDSQGNLICGTDDTGSVTAGSALNVTNLNASGQVLLATSSEKVAINTTVTGQTLTVVGTVNVTPPSSSSPGLFIDSAGEVGIGTASPTSKLHVVGDTNVTGSLIVDGKNVTSFTNATLLYGYNQSGNSFAPIAVTSGGALELSIVDDGGTTILGGGSTGIDLTLESNLLVGGLFNVTNTTRNATFQGSVRILGTLYGGSPLKIGNAINITAASGEDALFVSNSAGEKIFRITETGKLNITTSAGNTSFDDGTLFVDITNNLVGIGTLIPYNALTVVGSASVSGTLNASSINATGNAYFATVSGSVGIRTTAPTQALVVAGAVNITNGLNVSNGLTVQSGNVGIGNTIPNNTLDVSGNANITGRLSAGAFSVNSLSITSLNVTGETKLAASSGRLGVGTLTPDNLLTIMGNDISDSPVSALHVNITDNFNNSIINAVTIDRLLKSPGNLTGAVGLSVLFRTTDNLSQMENIANITAVLYNATNGSELSAITFSTRGPDIATGGGNLIERMMIDGRGRLGLNDSTPSETLDLTGTLRVVTGAGTEGLFVGSNGRVGVGALSPNVTFHVSGNANITGTLSTGSFEIQNAGAGTMNISGQTLLATDAGRVGIGNRNPNYLLQVAGGTDGRSVNLSNVLFVNGSTQRVGIGTMIPGTALQVSGNITTTASNTSVIKSSGFVSNIGGLLSNFGSSDGGFYFINNENGATSFVTAGADRIRIDQNGNVGIGNTQPNVTLHVSGRANITGYLEVGKGLNVSNGMNVLSGNVGIGTNSPQNRLEVIGSTTLAGGVNASSLNVTGFSITDDSLVTLADGGKKKIKDVKAGEEVLTLDEETGKLVARKVNALLDHGIKPIYEMATEDGRAINTTAEHPYFVKRINSELPIEIDLDFPSSFNSIKNPSKSLSSDLSLSNVENELFNDSILRCGILSQTTENIVSSVNSIKSSSLVTNILCSDFENSANLPFESPFGFKITSTPCFSRNRFNLKSTFSSKRNLSLEWDVDDDIFFAPSQICCVLQSRPYMLLIQGRECVKDFIKMGSILQHLQNLPDHNSGSLESGLSMADFAVRNDVLVDFDSHEAINDNSVYKTSDNELGRWIEVRYLKVGDDIAVPDYENCDYNKNEKENGSHSLTIAPRQTLLSSRTEAIKQNLFKYLSSEMEFPPPASIDSSDKYNGCGIKFVKISSIKSLEPQHVYDLSIEGTRNFIANDIVAHNTYLATSSGNVGIGTTAPGEKLHVVGNLNVSAGIKATNITITHENGTLWQSAYGTDDGLVLYIPFDSPNSTTHYDRSPYGNDARQINGTTCNATLGKYGSGCEFRDDKYYLAVADNPSIRFTHTSTFSMTAWVKLDDTAGGRIVSKAGASSVTNEEAILFGADSTGVNLKIDKENACVTSATTSQGLDFGRWYFAAGTYDGNRMRVYLNGEFGGTATACAAAGSAVTNELNIGRNNYVSGSEYINGTIDEVKIYNRVLSPEEIRTQYLSGLKSDGAIIANKFRIVNTTGGRKLELNDTAFAVHTAGSERFKIDSSGNVGIGTTGPASTLSVNGTSSPVYILGTSTGLTIDINDSNSPDPSNGYGESITLKNLNTGTSISTGIRFADANTAQSLGGIFSLQTGQSSGDEQAALTFWTTNSGDSGDGERMRIDTNGNVGIGTTNPRSMLEVAGNIKSEYNGNAALILNDTGGANREWTIRNGNSAIGSLDFMNSSGTKVTILTSGNVGIGTTNPTDLLQVGGSSGSNYVMVTGVSGTGTYGIKFRPAASSVYGFTISHTDNSGLNFIRHSNDATGVSSMFIDRDTGNVGINNTNPGMSLSIVGNGINVSANGAVLLNLGGSGDAANEIRLGAYTGAANDGFDVYYDGANNLFAIRSSDSDGAGTDADIIRIPNGGVAINGNGAFNDNQFGPSEWVIGKAEAGDLVCLIGAKIDEDGKKRAEAMPCDTANSQLIIGVVIPEGDDVHHGNPDFKYQDYLAEEFNMTGNQWLKHWRKTHIGIELTGFREIKVIGPIKTGDLLVSSEISGYATTSEAPKVGTVIGKALEDFKEEQGKILARIHLQ